MSSKKAPEVKSGGSRKTGFDPEQFRYFTAVYIILLLLGILILFRKFIFSDLMLYGSDTINAGVFFRHFYVEYFLKNWAVPVWNPYIFGGMPFIDAFHGDTFYPLSIYKFIGDFYRALGWNLIFHVFLSGIFMYLTARQFKLSKTASALSGTAYAFSGFLVSLVAPGHDGKIFVTTLFPLTILFLDRAFEKKPLLNFTLLGLVIGVIILSPHPQLSYYSLWAIALYGLYKLINHYREKRSLGSAIKPAGLLIYAVIIGLFISAVQFYPGYIYTTEYSPRAETKRGYDWATSWSMHPEEAFSQVVPEFVGVSGSKENTYWGRNFFKDNSEYVGVVPLFLALLGLFFSRRKGAWFFGGMAIFALIYALGDTTPFFYIFFYIIPMVKSLRAPSTIMFVYLFCISLLAGFGVQFLIEKGRELKDKSRQRFLACLFGVPALLLILAFLFGAAGESILSLYSSIFYSGAETTLAGENITKFQLGLMNLPHIQSGFWLAFLFVAISASVIYLYLKRQAGAVIFILLPLLAICDGIRFNSRFVETYDYRREFSPNPLTEYIKSLPGNFRVLNLRAMSENHLPYQGIEVVTGYHGNQLRWYDDLMGGTSMENVINPNFVNLVGAEFVLTSTQMQIPAEFFGPDSVTLARNFGPVSLYRNPNALPRALMVNRFEVIPERKDIIPQIMGGQADLRRSVYLEETPSLEVTASDTAVMSATVKIHNIDSVVVDVNSSANALLVLTDNYYPAWKAYVDGQETPIYRADASFRAVPVKAGASQVVFRYDKSYLNVAWLTWLTLLFVGLVLLFYLYKYMIYKRKKAAVV